MTRLPPVVVRQTEPRDFAQITELCCRVYPDSEPWDADHLASHLEVFPEGQLVAVTGEPERVVGMAASLIITWDDYEHQDAWRDLTMKGTFRNHDPTGRTLYGAEIMVDPTLRRRRIGARIYAARRDLARELGMARIRAGSRLRGYHRYAKRMTAEEYALAVVSGRLKDPTLTFQLREGFEVFDVVGGYLRQDPESLGFAALIEWLNPEVAGPEDRASRDLKWASSVAR